MFYEGINTKVFRRSIAFAITLVVMSRSSSFEYTMSVHAVHSGGERSVCNFVVLRDFAIVPLMVGRLVHLTTPFPGQA